jgi:hypothetical protein
VLVIGAQRSGSTYLSAALDEHPDITMARPAQPEPKVFCDPGSAARGAEWYHRTWFPHARNEQLLGEKSTSYLEDADAPARVADVLGETHVVAVLRDPVQRAVSHWRFSTEHGMEARGLEDALRADLGDEQPWDRAATSVSPFAYLRRGRYLEHLVPWSSSFPDTTHVVFTEELTTDPAVLKGLVRDLGLDPDAAPPPPAARVNKSGGARPRMSQALRVTLESYFEASNTALSAHLGRRLPW